jgi:cytochrome b involved in lipid metabolism
MANKVLTLAEVKQLAEDKNKCILIINNRVYDITKFMDEVCIENFTIGLDYFMLVISASGW